MCHGHPHYHSCGHQSVTWHYCPSALIDLETGYETPCPNMTFAASQSSTAACPLANCDFRSAGGGGWTCCKCGGRNSSGWCLNASPEPKWEKNSITNEWEWMERCDHGCCRSCTKDPQVSSGDVNRKEGRKGKESRRHRQNTSSSSPSSDSVASYNIELNYSGNDGDRSSKLSHRRR
ncbi:hypothetical protein F5144DRAFT_484336 [Chaetomium tenue]|uniref:Uncharacterized protein n=1 Tax=Chaetomium tenue TaxID=1854479 RepID=A0ACB7PKW7_9PEZI|nr:hypothetical protein F5144DRAFT_484336 [Chaetomium globosum]